MKYIPPGLDIAHTPITKGAQEMKKIKVAVLALFLSTVWIHQAQADSYTFGAVGDSALVSFAQAVTVNGTNYNLTGTVNYTVAGITSTGIAFNVVVSNTSNTGTNQGISATGFQVTSPTVGIVALVQSFPTGDTNKFIWAASNVNAPGGFQQVELCAYTSVNCSAASNPTTLKEGKHDTFLMLMSYQTPRTSNTFTMTNSFIRFAGALGSYTFGGTCSGNCGTLPLPSSLSIIGVGMVAWGLARRLRKS